MIFKKERKFRIRKLKDKIYLLCPNQAIELNDSGAFIWNAIDGEKSIEAIASELKGEYGLDDSPITDVADFLKYLKENDAVSQI